MRKLFAVAALALLVFAGCGDDNTNLPDFTVVNVTPTYSFSANEVSVDAYIKITNNTDQPLDLGWRRLTNDIHRDWQTAICDIFLCYTPETSTFDEYGRPNFGAWLVAPGDTDTLKVQVRPNGVVDTGLVVVELYDYNNPNTNSLDSITLISY